MAARILPFSVMAIPAGPSKIDSHGEVIIIIEKVWCNEWFLFLKLRVQYWCSGGEGQA